MENAEREMFRMFLENIRYYPLLTPREEKEAALRSRAGDPEARDRLVTSNLRFIAKRVNDLWRPGLPKMDMVSEAYVGLMRAARLYDPAKGIRFLSYAAKAVERGIMKAIARHRRQYALPFDEMVSLDHRSQAFADSLPRGDDVCFQGEVRDLLAYLSGKERAVMTLRYWHDKTLEETGGAIGVQKERVRQIETQALRKMRWSLCEGIGDPGAREAENFSTASREEVLGE